MRGREEEDGVVSDSVVHDPHQAAFIAQIYDGEHSDNEADVAWALRLARAAGGLVADLGCGTGRLTLPLAAAGCDVAAVDRSPAMLQRLQAKLAHRSPAVRDQVHAEQADLTAWSGHRGEVALAILGYNTFAALLTAEEQQRALAVIRTALRPGGRLAIATAAVGARVVALPEGLTREVYRRPAPELGRGVELSRRDIHRWTDETSQIRQLALLYDVLEPEGGRRQHQFDYAARYTSRWELEHLLVRGGFDDVRVSGGYDAEPFTVEVGLLVVTAAVPAR
ncbi:MAG: class I SAM-dependent methyltransferase [Chloroflexota bacterium]